MTMRDEDCIEPSGSNTDFMRGFRRGMVSANEDWRAAAARLRAAALDSAINAAWPHVDQNIFSDYDKGRMDAASAIRSLKST